MPIPQEQIHRMQAEKDIEANALAYEKTIQSVLKGRPFDLVMLGMGEDGHTASLFPHSKALHETKRLVVANYLSNKDTWRMTFTFTCINQASHIALYVLGAGKKYILAEVLTSADQFERLPSQHVGTPSTMPSGSLMSPLPRKFWPDKKRLNQHSSIESNFSFLLCLLQFSFSCHARRPYVIHRINTFIRQEAINPPQTPQTGKNLSPEKMSGNDFTEMLKTKIAFNSKGSDLAGRATQLAGNKAQDSAFDKCEIIKKQSYFHQRSYKVFFPLNH